MINNQIYPYDFSIIMAVFNVSPFLREAINSLLTQEYDFNRIQIIMVDDGSTDDSASICDEYAAVYPNNIIVIHKENGGVCSARNAGLEHATGKYINFMDADDKLSSDTLRYVSDFFSLYQEDTDIAAIPLFFFDGQTGEHTLNWKFNKGSRVVDLFREPSMIQLSMASVFVKHEVLNGMYFDSHLAYAEDAKLLLQLFLSKPTLGLIKEAVYYYRKRQTGELSAIQKSEKVPEWYFPYIEFFQEDAIKQSLNKYGYVPKFVQYTLAYDLQWRIRQQHIPEEILSPKEGIEYKTRLSNIIKYIDDDVILAQKSIWNEHKFHMLKIKYNDDLHMVKRSNDIYFRHENNNFYYLSNCQFTIEFIKLGLTECIIEGYTVLYPFEITPCNIFIKVNEQLIKCNKYFRQEETYSIDDPILKYYGFNCTIPLDKNQNLYNVSFYIDFDGVLIKKTNIHYKKYAPIGKEYINSYYTKDNWKIYVVDSHIHIEKCSCLDIVKSEFKLLTELWKSDKIGSRKAVFVRTLAHVAKWLKRKQIWLISDKANRADDNGEAFFNYLQKIKKDNIKPYFLIEKSSADYRRLKKVGNVLPYMSWQHKLIYLISDYTISAYSHDEINNPFFGYSGAYRDLLQACKFVFLQHGIIKDDLSIGLNRYHKNIKMFVCSTVPEYNSVINTPSYGYTSEDVVLTGLPRYDRLYHDEKNEIVIMPTWRHSLFGAYHAKDSRWDLKPGFKNSDYYIFYNKLLNNPKLLKAAKELGYVINFVPHPILFPYIEEFTVPDEVKLWGTEVIYRDMFAKNKLLITDFSSVAFDFAYLRKPVIYAHFDVNHYGEGYFNYEEDGFGEVEYTLDQVINRIIEYMTNGCQLKEPYLQRIDNFFAFNDQNNCQRVFDKILELDARNK